MNIDIKLHKNDLPEDLDLGNVIAVDGEFMGLNVPLSHVSYQCFGMADAIRRHDQYGNKMHTGLGISTVDWGSPSRPVSGFRLRTEIVFEF